MSITEEKAPPVKIGKFEFTIARAEDTPEVRKKWDSRIDALASLLFTQWRLEQESKN